jgi:hypothetical protein
MRCCRLLTRHREPLVLTATEQVTFLLLPQTVAAGTQTLDRACAGAAETGQWEASDVSLERLLPLRMTPIPPCSWKAGQALSWPLVLPPLKMRRRGTVQSSDPPRRRCRRGCQRRIGLRWRRVVSRAPINTHRGPGLRRRLWLRRPLCSSSRPAPQSHARTRPTSTFTRASDAPPLLARRVLPRPDCRLQLPRVWSRALCFEPALPCRRLLSTSSRESVPRHMQMPRTPLCCPAPAPPLILLTRRRLRFHAKVLLPQVVRAPVCLHQLQQWFRLPSLSDPLSRPCPLRLQRPRCST